MANLAGKFAGILLASVDSAQESALVEGLAKLREEGLAIDVDVIGQ